MAEIQDTSKKQQIRTLLTVIGSGVLAAVFLTVGLLSYYNPSGSYKAANALVEPASLATMRFSESTIRGGDNTPYLFEGLGFSYFDSATKQWKRASTTLAKYTEFYNQIAAENGISDVSDEIKSSFSIGHPATLSIKVKRDNVNAATTMDFIRVEFAEQGDYYRIQLRAHGTQDGWAYYYHPNIFNQAIQTFSH